MSMQVIHVVDINVNTAVLIVRIMCITDSTRNVIVLAAC